MTNFYQKTKNLWIHDVLKVAAGSTLRFYGLVFNDNGTLRMDSAQVNDGVAFSAQPSAAQQAHIDWSSVRQIRPAASGSLQQTISVTTR